MRVKNGNKESTRLLQEKKIETMKKHLYTAAPAV